MDPTLVATVLAAVLGGGAFAAIVTTLGQRRKVGADATAVVTAAARELVDPLRKELATERADHSREVELERAKVKEVRQELSQAMDEARALRRELAQARVEMDALRTANERYRLRIRELEMRGI